MSLDEPTPRATSMQHDVHIFMLDKARLMPVLFSQILHSLGLFEYFTPFRIHG